MYFKNTTWKCDICGKMREDEDVSVLTYGLEEFKDTNGNYYGERNLKYCNDNPECFLLAKEKAKTHKI